MIIDHFGFGVSDYELAKAFYASALAPLGITLVMEFGPEQTGGKVWACGFGTVENRAEVRAFYEAALRVGGRDNGGPGLRPQYHPNYYGAFVFDLDGHNIEVVCHRPA